MIRLKLDIIRKYNPHGCKIDFYELDMVNYGALCKVIYDLPERIDIVIHLAGLKAVAESIEKPVYYYCI